MPNKEDMGKLLTTINAADPEKALSKERLQNSFNRVWPEFERPFQELLRRHAKGDKPPQRTMEDMIVEVLEISRDLQRNSERLLRLSSEPVPAVFVGGGGGSSGYAGYSSKTGVFLTPEQAENLPLKLYSEVIQRAEKEKAKEKRPEKSG